MFFGQPEYVPPPAPFEGQPLYTRDSDDEAYGLADPQPNYDPDDPDYDHYTYASQCLFPDI